MSLHSATSFRRDPGTTRTRLLLIALLLLAPFLLATRGAAQIVRPGSIPQRIARTPTTWTSLGVGFMQLPVIADYTTATSWDFGTIIAWRASIEQAVGRSTMAGLTGMISRSGLAQYDGARCGPCEADGNVFQILGLVRTGGGGQFHQVIELQAGVTGFSNFRERGSSGSLPPAGTVWDPTASLGYGIGFTINPTFQVNVVQDYGIMLHRRGGNAPANADRTHQWLVTRLTARVGL